MFYYNVYALLLLIIIIFITTNIIIVFIKCKTLNFHYYNL